MNVTARRNSKGAKRRTLVEANEFVTVWTVMKPEFCGVALDFESETESVTINLTTAEVKKLLHSLHLFPKD